MACCASSGQPPAWATTNKDGNVKCIYSYRESAAPQMDSTQPNACPVTDSKTLLTLSAYEYDNPDTKSTAKTSIKYGRTELGGRYTAYDYDQLNRLESAITTSFKSSSNVIRKWQYTYDRHSNRTSSMTTGATTPGLSVGGFWQAYNLNDQVCAVKVQGTDPNIDCNSTVTGLTSYNYDGAGNLNTTNDSGAPAGLQIDYNRIGQTSSIDLPGSTPPVSMAYDGVTSDRRTQSGNTTMSYGFSGLTAQDTPADTGAGTSEHNELFVRDPDGTLLAMIDAGTFDTRYYLTDDQNTVQATITDATSPAASNVIRYLYDPYGKTIRSYVDTTAGNTSRSDAENDDGSTTDRGFTAPAVDRNPHGYVSGYNSQGFIKFGTRYYNPLTATWTQPDPKAGQLDNPGTLNGNTYVGGDPINRTDASGRYWGEDFVEGVGDFFGSEETQAAFDAANRNALGAAVAGCGFGAFATSFTGPGAALGCVEGGAIAGASTYVGTLVTEFLPD